MGQAKNLTWEEMPSGRVRGSCGTHCYTIMEDGIGPLLLIDNQNGWDCFSRLVADVKEGKAEAQNHFNELINSMTQ